MMNLLAIDTARSEGSVALMQGGLGTRSRSLGAGPRYGEVLFLEIERLLSACSLRLTDVDAIGVATGPGSFTGIRVGIAAAKALAEAGEHPVVGVSSLRALARSCPGDAPRVALLDARRGELFAGCYGADSLPMLPETVGGWQDLAPLLRGLDPVLVWNEPQIFEDGGPAEAASGWRRTPGPRMLAATVAEIARRDIEAGTGGLPEAIEANYIRRPSVTPPRRQAASR